MIPVAAHNAAFLVFASRFPNSDLVYSEDFIRAMDEALEAAAPHMLAVAEKSAYDRGWAAANAFRHQREITKGIRDGGMTSPVPPSNPHSSI